MTSLRQWPTAALVVFATGFLLRCALIGFNEAEYTDGILQLTQFENPTRIWPPLYTALCWLPSQVLEPLYVGRAMSVLAASLAAIPLYRMAERWGGARAALWCLLLYTLAPAALRWAPRVMTEATFTLFFWWSCERLFAVFDGRDADTTRRRAFVAACVLGGLAALTRYQGLLLAPLLVGAWWMHRRIIGGGALLAMLAFAAAPLWSVLAGNIHGSQFSERSGGSWQNALWVMLMNAEPFVLLSPYFLVFPVFLWMMAGVFRGNWHARTPLFPVALLIGLVMLAAQSSFSSFQERYFLPVYGFAWVIGGAGIVWALDSTSGIARRGVEYLIVLTLVWSAGISALVLGGSREAFGDLRRATELAVRTAPTDRPLFTNEVYRTQGTQLIAGDKVRFFAEGRDVVYLTERQLIGDEPLQVGDVLVLSDAYGSAQLLPILQARYRLELVGSASAAVTPVFPDIMSTPGTAQNPLAWFFRFTPQSFATQVYVVRGRP